jgi:hypothetical protein
VATPAPQALLEQLAQLEPPAPKALLVFKDLKADKVPKVNRDPKVPPDLKAQQVPKAKPA